MKHLAGFPFISECNSMILTYKTLCNGTSDQDILLPSCMNQHIPWDLVRPFSRFPYQLRNDGWGGGEWGKGIFWGGTLYIFPESVCLAPILIFWFQIKTVVFVHAFSCILLCFIAATPKIWLFTWTVLCLLVYVCVCLLFLCFIFVLSVQVSCLLYIV